MLCLLSEKGISQFSTVRNNASPAICREKCLLSQERFVSDFTFTPQISQPIQKSLIIRLLETAAFTGTCSQIEPTSLRFFPPIRFDWNAKADVDVHISGELVCQDIIEARMWQFPHFFVRDLSCCLLSNFRICLEKGRLFFLTGGGEASEGRSQPCDSCRGTHISRPQRRCVEEIVSSKTIMAWKTISDIRRETPLARECRSLFFQALLLHESYSIPLTASRTVRDNKKSLKSVHESVQTKVSLQHDTWDCNSGLLDLHARVKQSLRPPCGPWRTRFVRCGLTRAPEDDQLIWLWNVPTKRPRIKRSQNLPFAALPSRK